MKRFFPVIAFLILAIPVYCQDNGPKVSPMTVKSGKELTGAKNQMVTFSLTVYL